MKSFREIAMGDLVWVQPSRMKQDFELRSGDDVVATLHWERSSLTTAKTAFQSWTFKREGFWHPRITVRAPGSDANVAVFEAGWTGAGLLELGQGRSLRFGPANFWRSQWQWEEAKGSPLVQFKVSGRLLKLEGQVEIASQATAESPELPLLVVLGWYLLVRFAQNAAQASVAGVVR